MVWAFWPLAFNIFIEQIFTYPSWKAIILFRNAEPGEPIGSVSGDVQLPNFFNIQGHPGCSKMFQKRVKPPALNFYEPFGSPYIELKFRSRFNLGIDQSRSQLVLNPPVHVKPSTTEHISANMLMIVTVEITRVPHAVP